MYSLFFSLFPLFSVFYQGLSPLLSSNDFKKVPMCMCVCVIIIHAQLFNNRSMIEDPCASMCACSCVYKSRS